MEDIKIEGWKGKDEIEIENLGSEGYNVIENRKDKESFEVKEIKRHIPLANVVRVLKIIDSFNGELTYRDMAEKLIDELKLPVEINAWNGGSNRSKYYFPLHYYPLKILEKKGKITYSGRGNIKRI